MIQTLLLLAALTADPQAVVSGDTATLVGMPAKITASKSTNAKTYVWLVSPQPFYVEKFNNGADIRLGHDEPCTFHLTLVATSPDGGADTASWTLKVEAKAKAMPVAEVLPQQAVRALPQPQRQPSVQEIAAAVAKQLQSVEAAVVVWDATDALDKVDSASIRTDARKVGNCLIQEARFLNGQPSNELDTEKVAVDLAVLCKSVLTEEQWNGWQPWFEGMLLELDAKAEDGEMETMDDVAEVLVGYAKELRAFSSEST